MMRAVMGVLLVLAMAAVAGAGIPSAGDSYVTMDNGGKGLTTCPAGDGPAYGYITVTALRANLTPIVGIPAGSIFFTVTGTGSGNVAINAYDAETDVNGQCRFTAQGTGTVPYGSLSIAVQIYTVVLTTAPGTLWCNTFDLDGDGAVTPIDLSNFAGKYETVSEDCDFDWSGGIVNPIDLSVFAAHYEH